MTLWYTILVSTSIIADVTAVTQVKMMLEKSRELHRLTIDKLLELELSLSDYLSLPSRENDECIG